MNSEVSTVDQYVTQFESFLAAHPEAKWLGLACVFGWMIALILRPFIRMSPLSDELERHLVLLTCIFFSGVAAYRTWQGEYPLIVASVIGGLSPFIYIALAELLCWKWPSLKRHLSLRKDFAAAVDDEPEMPAEKEPRP